MAKHRRAKTSPKTKRIRKPSPLIVIPLILITIFVIFATTYKIIEVFLINNSISTLPKLEISLADVTTEQIDLGSKDTKYPGNTITFTNNGQSTTYTNVEVKGRGNTTWTLPKKPYQIKFENSENLFNFGPAKKWVLLANYLDDSHLRTDLAFKLEHILGEDYALDGDFVELYIDNSYRGLYYLTKKVETGKSRVNLKEPTGILVELDNTYGEVEGCNYDQKNNCFVVKDVIDENLTNLATQAFMDNINSLQSAIATKDFNTISSVINVDSFVKYYLLNEFLANPDAYSSSFYLYKDGDSDKIHAGPGWDFDFALSNTRWGADGIDSLSPDEDNMFKNYLARNDSNTKDPHMSTVSTLLYDLIDIPEFKTRIKEIYQDTISGKGEDLLDYIRSRANYIQTAALKNQNRWKLKTNFDEEADYLINWVAKRYNHFEELYGSDSDFTTSTSQI